MALSFKTNNSARVHIGEGMDGWTGGRGMRNQIKAKNYGVFTSRKDKVGDTQDVIREMEERERLIGEGYGSAIKHSEQVRGRDQMRKIDYSGNNSGTVNSNKIGSSSGVGLPLGKVQTISEIDTTQGILKEYIRGTTGQLNRLPVYNVGNGSANNSFYSFIDVEHRGMKSHETAALKMDDLFSSISVQPTAVYSAKQIAEPFNTQIKSNVKPQMLNGNLVSGVNTKTKFDLDKKYLITNGMTDRIYAEGVTGERHMTRNPIEHVLRVLDSKISTTGFTGKSHRSRNEKEHLLRDLESKLTVEGFTGKSYRSKDEKEHLLRELDAKLSVEGFTGKTYFTKEEKEHALRDLEPKLSTEAFASRRFFTKEEKEHALRDLEPQLAVTNVTSNISDKRISKIVEHTNEIKFSQTPVVTEIIPAERITQQFSSHREPVALKETRKEVAQFIPSHERIKQVHSLERDEIQLKPSRPSMDGFASQAAPTYPV